MRQVEGSEAIHLHLVVRHEAFHRLPERSRVVRMRDVRKLVHDHIVEEIFWNEEERRIESDRASSGAASPADACDTHMCTLQWDIERQQVDPFHGASDALELTA